MRVRLRVAGGALAVAVALAGCGGDEEGGAADPPTQSTTTEAVVEVPPAADEEAKLPDGWKSSRNNKAGFSFGVPPGWRARPAAQGQGTLLTSPDGLVTVSITADRTEAGLKIDLEDFARRTGDALGGEIAGPSQFDGLKVGPPASFDHTYDAVAVRAIGTPANTGVMEGVFVVAIRREDSASFVAVVRQNKEQDSSISKNTTKRIIRSIRSQEPKSG